MGIATLCLRANGQSLISCSGLSQCCFTGVFAAWLSHVSQGGGGYMLGWAPALPLDNPTHADWRQ